MLSNEKLFLIEWSWDEYELYYHGKVIFITNIVSRYLSWIINERCQAKKNDNNKRKNVSTLISLKHKKK